jgi:hypothetical protein
LVRYAVIGRIPVLFAYLRLVIVSQYIYRLFVSTIVFVVFCVVDEYVRRVIVPDLRDDARAGNHFDRADTATCPAATTEQSAFFGDTDL